MSETAICHFCGNDGAESMAGIGNVPGVAVHAECWLRDQGGDS